jgi:hypothetical protein
MTGHQPPQGPQRDLSEGFESGGFSALEWRRSGDEWWAVSWDQTHSGQRSAQAGAIGDNGTTTLEITVACREGDVRFWRKVSSEQSWDLLRFSIDGVQAGQWSGEQDWVEVSLPVKAGQRIFRWSYTKDGSGLSGADTAWIDDILFPAL